MGVLLIVLGLAAAGLVADFLVENHLTSAPAESLTLLGTSFRFSQPELVLSAFIAGALAIVLVLSGARLVKGGWGRRRELKSRLDDLKRENAELRTEHPDG